MKKKQKAEAEKQKPEKNRQTQEKAGLTLSEKKRLAELKRALAGNSKEQAKPDTAQKTITFKKMYRDGICQVADNYYTKMVEFYDINYDLLEVEDQADILEEYSKLINYFDPSIKFQLFLFNRQVSEQALAEQFDIALQEDDFDDIRDEYTQMLKHQSAKGNNGIIKSKYLIFGVESAGYREAKSKLSNIEKDVVHNLNNIGTNARGLDGKERLRILHEYFNQGTMEPFRFSFKELSESGKSVKDYIAPPGFDFRYPSRFKSGSIYGSVSYLDMIAPKFTDEMVKKLLDIDDNLTLTMHMQTIDPVEAIKMIKRALTDIQKMKIEEQRTAAGKHVTGALPYGYLHDPDDRQKWILDEEAAPVVKRIFQGVIEGKPLARIAEELTAERILTPAAHWRAIGERVSMGASGADPYKWATATLIQILKKEEYMGWTVLNKTATESYKSKKREATPQENRLIFKDTHPAIIDEETWNVVQRLRETKRVRERIGGEPNPLTGVLYCADCGQKMYHKQGSTGRPNHPHHEYVCSSYRHYSRSCTCHYIRVSVVESLVLEAIRRVSGYVRENEAEFIERVREKSSLQQKAAVKESRKKLSKATRRREEISGLKWESYLTLFHLL